MSILDPLLRFVDPIAYRKRMADRRRAQEVRPDNPDKETFLESPKPAPKSGARRQCRVCGKVDTTAFCLDCLADTMVEVRG